MMLNWIKSKFNTQVVSPSEAVEAPGKQQAAVKASGQESFGLNAPATRIRNIYPPDDPGIQIISTDELIQSNAQLLARLKLHAASPDHLFQERFLNPITRLAQHINALPGTSSGIFAGEAGLFRACIELGFLAFQASDGRIFTGNDTVEIRHKLEPKWRYVCFIAGLLYPVGKSVTRMVVTDSSGKSWPRHHAGIAQWVESTKSDRLYVAWPGEEHSLKDPVGPAPYTGSIAHLIVGPENLSWLEDGSSELTAAYLAIVTGHTATAKIAADVVATMFKKVVEREQLRRPQSYGRVTVGTHITPYLVGTMKDLLESAKWKPNELPVFVDSTGIYLVWPKAGEDLVEAGAAHDGWPQSASVLLEILKAAGVFDTSRGNDLGQVDVVDRDGEVHSGYLLKNPRSVMESYEPRDYAKSAPKTVEGILAKDPLAKKEAESIAEEKSSGTPANQDDLFATASPANLLPDESVSDSDDEDDAEPAIKAASEEPASSRKEQKTQVKKAPTVDVPDGKINEVKDINFSEYVSDELKAEFKDKLLIEILGKVIKGWQDKEPDSPHMRLLDDGTAAFSIEYLAGLMRSLPDFSRKIAEKGYLAAPAKTPGRLVSPVAIPEGTKPKDAMIFTKLAVRKFKL